MTQEPNQGSGPGPNDDTIGWTPPPSEPETPAPIEPAVPAVPAAQAPGAAAARMDAETGPTIEPADDGPIVRREPVARETGTFGADTAGSPRSSGLRWAIALGGVAVVVAATIGIIALASGRPATSVAVGYMPEGTIQYAEYRLDLPGDQRQKLAAFLSHFPGFADQASVDTKIDEILDRLLSEASKGEQTWTADIKPWFGGQIAMGSGPLTMDAFGGAMSGAMGMSPFGPGSLIVVTVKDPSIATAWVQEVIGASAASSQYGDATLIFTGTGGYVVGINGEVMLAGQDAAVRAAIDSKGDGKLADDAEFQAAFKTVTSDYVAFSYNEYRAYVRSLVDMIGGGRDSGGLDQTIVDDELIDLVPAWQSTVMRIEADALVAESAFPSIDFGFDANNKRSALAGNVPPGTIFYAEAHDVGAALKTFIDRLREMPELRDAFGQIDQGAGMIGGVDGLIGWWGDVGVAVTKTADGEIGGGLLIAPTDVDAANRTFTTLRSLVALAGGQAGIAVRDVQHGDTTITVVDFSEAAAGTPDLPPGFKPEIAYAVTRDVAVIGYGEAWVASVLDAGPGPSLADDARYKSLLDRVGAENIGVTFVDVTGLRELVEPLARDQLPRDQWDFYALEIVPYLSHFDAAVGGSRQDGDLDRMPQVITVK